MPKRVCVIGAGPCGLTTIKQCQDEGLMVTAYESEPGVGGIWNRQGDDKKHMKVFDNLYLTISAKLMTFSDYMIKGDRAFFTHAEYQAYLEKYTDKFMLRDAVTFNHRVVGVEKKGKLYYVTAKCNKSNKDVTTVHDAVAVCSGPFQVPKPLPDNLAGFEGEVHHSSSYRNNADFAGKRVLILGLAESGADIVREISSVSSECTLSLRSRSFLLPRLFDGHISTDKGTWRNHHYEMHANTEFPFGYTGVHGSGLTRMIFYPCNVFWGVAFSLFTLARGALMGAPLAGINNLQQPMYPLKMDRDCLFTQEHVDAVNDWNSKSHKGASTWGPKIIFSKNVSFIANLCAGKFVINDGGIKHAMGKKVFFKNGEAREFDAVMMCTGFKKQFDVYGKATAVKNNNVRTLYKHCIHPDHDGALGFMGWCRPFTGGIPISAEMQARYFAAVNSGRISLPKDMDARIKKEKQWEDYWTQYSPRCDEAIPSQAMFCDDMARQLGCLPSPWQMIFRPRVMIAMMSCPFNQSCYRLQGKFNNGREAWREFLSEYPADLNAGLNMMLCLLWVTDLIPKPFKLRPKHLPLPGPTAEAMRMSTM